MSQVASSTNDQYPNRPQLRVVSGQEPTISVSKDLESEHGVTDATPGRCCTCPKCGRKKLGINPEDTGAKCFVCNFTLSSRHAKTSAHPIDSVLQQLFDLCRKVLIDAGPEAHDALQWFQSRQIPDQVLHDVDGIGVVPPGFLKIGQDLLKPIVEDLEKRVAEEKPPASESKSKGRPAKKEQTENERILKFHKDAIDKFNKSCQDVEGWVVFAYREKGRIKSLKFRKPHNNQKKTMTWYKPMADGGVFGFDVFTELDLEDRPEIDYQIIMEGELDRLQLFAACHRLGTALSKPVCYPPALAFGSVTSGDWETIRKTDKKILICYDNDPAGRKLLLTLEQMFTFEAFSTPHPYKDLDEFLRAGAADPIGTWESLQKLIASKEFHERSYTGVADEIYLIRQKHGPYDLRRQFEIHKAVVRHILCDLSKRALLYFDGEFGYIFFRGSKALVRIFAEDPDFIRALGQYGIFPSENIFDYVTEGINHSARESGIRTIVRKLAFYNKHSGILYVHNGDSIVYRIPPEPDPITAVDNGCDGVLFLKEPWFEPFYADINEEPTTHHLDDLIFNTINIAAAGQLTPEEARLLYFYWVFGTFFSSILHSKPLLVFYGPKGSGKTSQLRKHAKFLFGSSGDVSGVGNDADFDAVVATFPVAFIDQVDGETKWLNDKLAAVATGQTIRKRKLFKTLQMAEFPVNCFVALTSRTPRFNRDDVSDRCLVFRTQRFQSFKTEDFLDDIIQGRNLLWSEALFTLRKFVSALEKEREERLETVMRLGDFGSFVLKLNRQTRPDGESEMNRIFEKLRAEQDFFTLTDDPVVDLLGIWTDKLTNQNRSVLNPELFNDLKEIASTHNIRLPYDSARAFSNHLATIRESLTQEFVITENINHTNKKQNQKAYCYARRYQ